MAYWALECTNCRRLFQHSPIEEARFGFGMFIPAKPEMPIAGSKLTCPHCQKIDTYRRNQFIYRVGRASPV